MSAVDNKLKKIHDARQISAMLISAKEKHHPVYVWRIVGDKKIMAEVQLDLVIPTRGEIRLSPKGDSQLAFTHVVGGCDTVNLFFSHTAILFQSSIKGSHGEHGLIVSMPSFVAHMERRHWLRMPGENHPKLRIQFNKRVTYPRTMNQFFSKSICDLGAGGASFYATKAELRFLSEGELLKGLELVIDGKKIKVNVNILRIQEQAKQAFPASLGKLYKVSLRFDHIDKKDQETLAKYVFQNLPTTHQAV